MYKALLKAIHELINGKVVILRLSSHYHLYAETSYTALWANLPLDNGAITGGEVGKKYLVDSSILAYTECPVVLDPVVTSCGDAVGHKSHAVGPKPYPRLKPYARLATSPGKLARLLAGLPVTDTVLGASKALEPFIGFLDGGDLGVQGPRGLRPRDLVDTLVSGEAFQPGAVAVPKYYLLVAAKLPEEAGLVLEPGETRGGKRVLLVEAGAGEWRLAFLVASRRLGPGDRQGLHALVEDPVPETPKKGAYIVFHGPMLSRVLKVLQGTRALVEGDKVIQFLDGGWIAWSLAVAQPWGAKGRPSGTYLVKPGIPARLLDLLDALARAHLWYTGDRLYAWDAEVGVEAGELAGRLRRRVSEALALAKPGYEAAEIPVDHVLAAAKTIEDSGGLGDQVVLSGDRLLAGDKWIPVPGLDAREPLRLPARLLVLAAMAMRGVRVYRRMGRTIAVAGDGEVVYMG